MKKWFSITMLCVIVASFSNFVYSADLKKSVCVVRKSISEEEKELYKKTAKVLYDNSFMAASRSLERYSGGFGSGFVVKDAAGKLVLVTNKHVVKNADLVDLTFTIDDKDTVLRACPVIAKSDTLDIALVEFPQDKKSHVTPLEFDTDKLQDGISVWTAGFPGLGNDPAWQLGNGIVSNGSYFNLEMSDSAHIRVIQHTAQVDPGSSGGPLMIKKGDSYFVVGMNTWKALARENANFSLKAADVKAYLNSPKKNEGAASASSKNELKKVAEKFREGLAETTPDSIAQYFSTKMVTSYPEDKLKAILGAVSSYTASVLRDAYPIAGLKLATADVVRASLKKPAEVALGNVSVSGNKGTATYTYKKQTFTTKWEKFPEGWKITSTDFIPEEIDKDGEFVSSEAGLLGTGFRILDLSECSRLELMAWPSLNDPLVFTDEASNQTRVTTYTPKARFGFSYGGFLGRFVINGVELDFGTCPMTDVIYLNKSDGSNGTNEWLDDETKNFSVGVTYNIGAQCPMAINRLFISPEVVGGVGIQAGGIGFATKLTLSPSVNVGFILNKSKILYAGLGYRLCGTPSSVLSDFPISRYDFLTTKIGFIF